MVVSAHCLASEVGVNIMKKGGNAIDAAVAAGFALSVVFPEAGNIGGGGFMLIRKQDGSSIVIDFREQAPKASHRNMYLDSHGNATDKSLEGYLSVAVPGTVAGLIKALEEYGTMDLHSVIQPSIELAENGFVVDQHLESNIRAYAEKLKMYPATFKTFFRGDTTYIEGDTLRQPELAATLRRIQKGGIDEFYHGRTAKLMIEEMQRGGGLITMEDLADYTPIVRKPLRTNYRGYEIISIPPPSSGGICLIELLNTIEGYDLTSMGYHSSRSLHVMTEAMKRVYADRAEFLGDPEFISIPTENLISKQYATNRRAEIDTLKATPGNLIRHGIDPLQEGNNTTHFVVIDSSGNVVSTTYTINDLFGSKVVVTGAGFFLNDEMDDFSIKSGEPNAYGLIGGTANAIEPGKRPLSSMTPTIVLKDGNPIMVLGARGGSRIITGVFQTIINVIDFGMNMCEAVDALRFHHQWMPDELIYEKYCLSKDVVENLERKGHTLKETNSKVGALETIYIDHINGWIYGVPDDREGGVADGF